MFNPGQTGKLKEVDSGANAYAEDVFISPQASVKDALKKLDKITEKVLLVVDSKKVFLGTITDGDVRRYILSGRRLEDDVTAVYNRNPIYIRKEDYSPVALKEVLLKNKIKLLPILDEEGKVVDFSSWDDVFMEAQPAAPGKAKINVPVVIMAGGVGSRLDPFTKILPKALIPIDDKPIIEIIIEEFCRQGVREYYLSLNHKAKMVEVYFDNVEKDYQMHYIREKGFMGTAGSLKLLQDKDNDLFIVSNCDVMVRADFQEVISRHREQGAFLTVLSSIQHHKIPYGVVSFKEEGQVTDIYEKPEYTFVINTGVYVLSKECLQFIPAHTYFDMTDLIKVLISKDKKIITYPVNESAYMDIGQWEEYKKTMDKWQFFK